MFLVLPIFGVEQGPPRVARRQGPREFCPTPTQRENVREMSSEGVPQCEICRMLGLSLKTFRKHFREEIREGLLERRTRPKRPRFPWSLPVSQQRAILARPLAPPGVLDKP